MGHNGYLIYRLRGRYYVTDNPRDSYPSGLGKKILSEIPTDREKFDGEYYPLSSITLLSPVHILTRTSMEVGPNCAIPLGGNPNSPSRSGSTAPCLQRRGVLGLCPDALPTLPPPGYLYRLDLCR